MARVVARAVRTRQRPLRQDLVVPVRRLGPAPQRPRRRGGGGPGPAAQRPAQRPSTLRGAAGPPPPGRAVRDAARRTRWRRRPRRRPTGRRAGRRGRASPGPTSGASCGGSPPWPRRSTGCGPGSRPRAAPRPVRGAARCWRRPGGGILSAEEQASLFRPRNVSLEEVPWTPADAALVDEARPLLGPRRPRSTRARNDGRQRLERAREEVGFWPTGLDTAPVAAEGGRIDHDGEEIRSYGHIVVDEVQDLSPMQLRMLARRSHLGLDDRGR